MDGKKEMEYYWQDRVNYDEFSALNIHNLVDKYKKYINENKKQVGIGKAVIFVDNPFNSVKAFVKLLLKRGHGYKYRKQK